MVYRSGSPGTWGVGGRSSRRSRPAHTSDSGACELTTMTDSCQQRTDIEDGERDTRASFLPCHGNRGPGTIERSGRSQHGAFLVLPTLPTTHRRFGGSTARAHHSPIRLLQCAARSTRHGVPVTATVNHANPSYSPARRIRTQCMADFRNN